MTAQPLTALSDYRKSHEPEISRSKLAKQFGVSRATVSRWESGKRRPDRKYLPDISKLTGVPIAELMGFVEAAE